MSPGAKVSAGRFLIGHSFFGHAGFFGAADERRRISAPRSGGLGGLDLLDRRIACGPFFFGGEANVGIIVSNLLAGIVFVDWLAVAPESSHWLTLILLVLFGSTKLLQKFVPATLLIFTAISCLSDCG